MKSMPQTILGPCQAYEMELFSKNTEELDRFRHDLCMSSMQTPNMIFPHLRYFPYPEVNQRVTSKLKTMLRKLLSKRVNFLNYYLSICQSFVSK